MSHVSNIAHVEGGSGTFVASVHTPYDRELLREHVEKLAGRAALLTIGLRGTRWTVTRSIADSRCTTCTRFLGRLSCSRGDDTGATCIKCVMQPGTTESTHGENK